MKSPFSVQRIRKAVKKAPRNQQRKKKESGETNNRLTVQTWKSSERAGAIDGDVPKKPKRNAVKLKTQSLTNQTIHCSISELNRTQ